MKDPLRREKRAKSVAQSPISGMDEYRIKSGHPFNEHYNWT